jgi:hypothetical protein
MMRLPTDDPAPAAELLLLMLSGDTGGFLRATRRDPNVLIGGLVQIAYALGIAQYGDPHTLAEALGEYLSPGAVREVTP